MEGWDIFTAVAGTLITGGVGFIYGRVYNHEVRIVKLETEKEGIAGALGEIKAALNTANQQIQSLRETVARNNL